jgi:replicative DNA helicase
MLPSWEAFGRVVAVPPMAFSPSPTLDLGLPGNPDAERLVLGAVFLDSALFLQVAAELNSDDFSLEKHRRIFSAMNELYERGERIDRVVVAVELQKKGLLESVDGLSYLASLDEGLPDLINIEGYIRIVKDKSLLRKMIFNAQALIDRCLLGAEEPILILASAEESMLKLN